MRIKMSKPVYQFLLGLFMLSFVAVACNSKKGDKKATTEDSIKVKPVDPGTNEPVDPGTSKPTTPDSIKKKPDDGGTQ